jgi:hypothetical protein
MGYGLVLGLGLGLWLGFELRVMVYRSAKNCIRFFWDELRTLPVGLSM